MSTPDLFNNKGTAVAVQTPNALTSLLAGGSGGTNRRISIRGGVFREIVNGQEVNVHDSRALNLVIVNAAPVSRTYYAGEYQEDVKTSPTCWSPDGKTPDVSVPADKRQSPTCNSCPKNIKGSGTGDSRACRYQQRLAVMLADNDGILEGDVYQLTIPATSLFGDSKDEKMSLQVYARYLQGYKTDISTIVTEARLDPASSTPKLVFKAVRPLVEDELARVQEMAQSEDAIKAVTMTVSAMDDAPAAATPTPAPTPAPAPKAAEPKPEPKKPAGLFGDSTPAPAEAKKPRGRPPATAKSAEAPVPEPVKAPSAKPAQQVPADLSSVIDNWDDE